MYGYIETKNSKCESLQIKKWLPGKKHEELEFYELTRATFLTECQGIKIRMFSNSSLKVWLHLKRDFLFKIIFNSLNDVT